MEKKYNKLTQRLLEQGYTADNYPKSMVRIGGGGYNHENPLDNYNGGFEYLRIYCEGLVYKTPCGLHIQGKNVFDNVGWNGIEWCHENENPLFICPYGNQDCKYRPSVLKDSTMATKGWCCCHPVNEVYQHEKSVEHIIEERQKEKEKKYQEYVLLHKGRVCRNHMYYDESIGEWSMRYKPVVCAKSCCSENGYCPILGKQLSRKRGNVYYDLVKRGRIKKAKGQLSLFEEKETWESVHRNIRFFDKPCSIDICEAFIKRQKEEISRWYEVNHSYEKWIDSSFQFEIINVRAECKPSRDLLQDLEDLRNGITIYYDDEEEKLRKEKKKQHKEELQQKKVAKLEKKIREIGYENLEPFSSDKMHADKWFTRERLEQLEDERQQLIIKKQNELVQLSLLDYLSL